MSHYDLLGVSRTATAAEIRAAYRRLARSTHPDHAGSARDMAAINEAWRVLGDPARRAAYDRLLVHGATRAASPAADGGAALDDDEEELTGRPAGRAGYFTGLPWLIVLAVLAVIFVFTAYAAGGGGGDGDGDERRPDGLVQRGDCVRLRTGHPAEEVPCSAEFDGVVAAIVTPGATCPVGSEPALGPVGSEHLCLTPG